ncbi:N-acetyltransferase [Nocardiopsis sp. N85]|uniref:GNAT family N-acetyltransferase n=1 Tax=Nocardiopsis sp. N85 TaxID=3029400 RepID=UPI00237F58D3|nr:N-acetyltransferase [Nocardiopsis sp. N85]MDE3722213.1 N-acetyltransferase [Nocardiopsis sp. N85]
MDRHTIVEGTEADHPACAALWTRAVAHRDGTAPDPVVRARAEHRLLHTPRLLLLLRTPALNGYTLTRLPTGGERTAHLTHLAVAPALQGTGWGRRLMDATLARVADHADSLTLEVLHANTAGRALYEATGWYPVGESRFPESGIPNIVYRRDL